MAELQVQNVQWCLAKSSRDTVQSARVHGWETKTSKGKYKGYSPHCDKVHSDQGHDRFETHDSPIGTVMDGMKSNEKVLQGSVETTIDVFLAVSVLKAKGSKLLGESLGPDDVVKILNDLSGIQKSVCTGVLRFYKRDLA
ncbi:hypothetical protein SUGI_0365290 [Cryptomeria japonica]|nr:hypothetical protein SUGI_0365290 [Cryptomeria japonica]